VFAAWLVLMPDAMAVTNRSEAAIDNGCESPLIAAMRVEESRLALMGLSKLDQIERHDISARFGLDGETPKNPGQSGSSLWG
jgi:DNA-directed RNA polymerase sigma subunit (sigma70/sigma32)